MIDSPDGTARGNSWPIGLTVIRCLTVAAVAVAAYLLVVSLGEQRLPVGCGSGSGCASVLSSRWSTVLGIPVGGFAVVVYCAVLAGSFLVASRKSIQLQRAGWSLLIGGATAITGAAAWFIWLQVAVVDAICPWCMVDHGLGLLVSTVIGYQYWTHSSRAVVAAPSNPGTDGATVPARTPSVLKPALAGILAVGLLAGTQTLFEGSKGRTIRLPPGQNADTGPGPERQISVIDGKFQLAPHEQPVLGTADSPKLLIVMFDYCCPHCRATHGYLTNALPSFDGQLSVLLLPMPMDHKCNKTLEHTEPRFEHACELARLALAVWRAKPGAFAEFDKWLFEPERPRDPVESRRKAEELVGAGPLEKALRDEWISKQITSNVQAYADSGANRIPVLMSPGFSSIVGRPESEEELLKTLQTELKLERHE